MNKSVRAVVILLFLGLLLTPLGSCGGGGNSGPTPPYISLGLFSFPTVSSEPAGFHSAMVVVKDGASGADITSAVVTVNTTTLTYNASAGHQEYEGNVAVSPGGTVDLSVTIGGSTYSASGHQFTLYPRISTPAPGATLSALSNNSVTWTGGSPTGNSIYALGVLNPADPSGTLIWPAGNGLKAEPITTYTDTIPSGSLSSGTRFVMACIATGVLIPNASADSMMVIAGCNYVSITVN